MSTPTSAQAITLIGLSGILFVIAAILSNFIESFGNFILHIFTMDKDQEWLLNFSRQYICWYTIVSNKHPVIKKDVLDGIRMVCLKMLDPLYNNLNVKEANHLPPKERLFQSPDDFDIYCDRTKSENYIFHGPELNCDIDHLEFNIFTCRIVVFTKDLRELDLGARIRWLIFPHLARDQYIFIVRTKDGKAIDGVEVFMKVVTK